MSIQSPAKCEIRSVIRYLVWKGKTPVEVYNEVKTAYGDKGMNRTSVFKWCREFKNGRTSVHDDQRSGRPSILTDDIVEKIENALRGDRRVTVDELSAMFPQISRSLLHETITETLGYRKLSARWVPKQLTGQHKLNQVEAGQEFLRRYKLHGDEFFRSIVTGDETWVEKRLNNKLGKRVRKGVIPCTMTLNDNKIDYVHWDDPNELNAHDNEILSIIEELREGWLYYKLKRNTQSFYNKIIIKMQKLLKKHNINHYSTYSIMKHNGNYKWIELLPRLVSKYNARKHRTIGMWPIDVTPTIADKLLNTVYSSIKVIALLRFKVGDSIRVSKFKTIFEKGYTPNWTTEVFRIIKVYELHPDVYLIEKVLRKKRDKVYVKWLGFNNSHNSWIQDVMLRQYVIKIKFITNCIIIFFPM
ncbi:SETMR methyltransferase, partial [Pseudoatta argentina]